ncbi:MAG: M28 family metallopeptidase [bacterium]
MIKWLDKLFYIPNRYYLMNPIHFLRFIICGILLSGILVASTVSVFSQSTQVNQFVIIDYDTDNQLKEVDQFGIKILYYQTDKIIAVISPEQEKWLHNNGYQIKPLDIQLEPNTALYLIQSFIPNRSKSIIEYRAQRQTDRVTLSRYGLIEELQPGTYLVKTKLTNINTLKELGYEILNLDGRTVLPWIIPPNPAGASPQKRQIIQSLVNQVSWSNLSSHILVLQDNDTVAGWDRYGSRYSFYTTLWASKAEYIATTFQSFGLNVEMQYFLHNGYLLHNIIAVQPGMDTSGYYILSAHYDSYSNVTPLHIPAPGADDNASGTSAVLEIARLLSSVTTRYPIKYITFGAEEQMGYGWSGAYAYASTAFYNSDSIFGVINLDMIGWDWSDPNTAMSIGNTTSEWIVDVMVANNTVYHIGLNTVLKVIDSNIWYSDHGAFWKYGYPAMFNIEWLNDSYRPKNTNYHTRGDYLDTLKPEFVTKMTQLALTTITELADIVLPPTKVEPCPWQLYK